MVGAILHLQINLNDFIKVLNSFEVVARLKPTTYANLFDPYQCKLKKFFLSYDGEYVSQIPFIDSHTTTKNL